ncbi:NifU family protein [Micromonospora sp. NPDC005299]|uniref:NifU family protein n=1 Tax=Micromonospora sp. NPDC005299 TaxID=3364231 RepID=UPI0036C895FE
MQPHDEDLAIRAQGVLNRAVRPLLNIDAGDVEITDVTDGRISVSLIGSCGRCMFRANCVHNVVVPELVHQLGMAVEDVAVKGVRVRPAALQFRHDVDRTALPAASSQSKDESA